MTETLAFCQSVTFGYGRSKPVIRDLDLGVRPGDLVMVKGANGTGKTTLLRLLAGMLRPLRGTLTAASSRCFVPVDTHFHETLTVREELNYLSSAGTLRPSVLAASARWFGFGEELLDQEISSLSSGWRQRLALSVAHAAGPSLLLLDEPLANLDPDAVMVTGDWLRKTTRAGGAVIVVHHGTLGALADAVTAEVVLESRAARPVGVSR